MKKHNTNFGLLRSTPIHKKQKNISVNTQKIISVNTGENEFELKNFG